MPEDQLPSSDPIDPSQLVPNDGRDSKVLSMPTSEPLLCASCSEVVDVVEIDDINLANESVAGEEDPGASLDIPPG